MIKAKGFRERKPNIQEIEVDYRRKRSPSIPYDRVAYSAEDHFMKGRWNESEFQQTMRGYRCWADLEWKSEVMTTQARVVD